MRWSDHSSRWMAPSSGEREVDTLDLTGEVCPYTFVRTRLHLEELPLGATLYVIVDHEPATRNIPRSAAEWGQEVISVEARGPGRWVIALVKRAE